MWLAPHHRIPNAMNKFASEPHRSAERTPASIKAIIRVREDEDTSWTENAATVSVSGLGAGFYLSRKCEVGCLISLIMALPENFRKYDLDKELYRVWGVVQHCSPITIDDLDVFYVGVAFTGKQAPASYQSDPRQSYRILGLSNEGLWSVLEMEKPFVSRRYPRYAVAREVTLIKLGRKKKPLREEKGLTENVSAGGASVLSQMETAINEQIQFRDELFEFSSLATVKHIQVVDPEIYRLCLQFVEETFPVKEIIMAFEDETVH